MMETVGVIENGAVDRAVCSSHRATLVCLQLQVSPDSNIKLHPSVLTSCN